MGKRLYPIELRDKVVKAYLNGEGGYKKLAKQYNLKRDTVRGWIMAYRKKARGGEVKPSAKGGGAKSRESQATQ